jgi:hypothetical protein
MNKVEIDNDKLLNLQRAVYDVVIRDCGRVDRSIREAMGDNPDIKFYWRLVQAAIRTYMDDDGNIIKLHNPTGQMGLENGFVEGLKDSLNQNKNSE